MRLVLVDLGRKLPIATDTGQWMSDPVLSFLDFSVSQRKALKLTQGFCPLPNPLKPWKKNRETHTQITNEIPCLKLTKEFKKKPRKGRTVEVRLTALQHSIVCEPCPWQLRSSKHHKHICPISIHSSNPMLVCDHGGTSSHVISLTLPHNPFFGLTLQILSTVSKLGALQKARLRKVHFSGDFLGVFDFLRIACSLGIAQENL